MTPWKDVHEQRCSNCDKDTEHKVEISIRQESSEGENKRFSREPYREAVCTVCGNTEVRRMNNE